MKDLPSKEKQNPQLQTDGTWGGGHWDGSVEWRRREEGGIRKRMQGSTDNTKGHLRFQVKTFYRRRFTHTDTHTYETCGDRCKNK